MTKLLLGSVGLLAIVYALICGGLWLWQTRLIFFPSPVISATPAKFGLSYEEVWIPIAPSTDRIHGWWIPAANRGKTLLYLHGNGGNIGSNVAYADRFHQLGLSVLLIDYRGYGQSEGRFPSEERVYEDAQAAWNYLTQTRRIPARQIVLYGQSLGGAVSIELATRYPDAAALIVESTFTSIQGMVDRLSSYHFLPIHLILNQRFDSIAKIRAIQIPVLLIHGTADATVPYDMSETLYAAAPQPKQLWIVPHATHYNVATLTGSTYLKVVQQFLDRAKR